MMTTAAAKASRQRHGLAPADIVGWRGWPTRSTPAGPERWVGRGMLRADVAVRGADAGVRVGRFVGESVRPGARGGVWAGVLRRGVGGVRRRRRAGGLVVHGRVTIIDLRRRYHPGDDQPADEQPGRYSHRWVVSGHWRRQPYGPGRELRHRIWIADHLKGPDGAPLLVRERVNVWRR